MSEKQYLNPHLDDTTLGSTKKINIELTDEIRHFVDKTLDLLIELTFADQGSCYFFDSQSRLTSIHQKQHNPELIEIAAWCIQNDKNLMYVPGASNVQFNYPWSVLCVRIKSRNRFAGSIVLAKSSDETMFYKSDFKLLESFADSLASQIYGIIRNDQNKLFVSFSNSLLPLLEKTWLEQKINDARYRLDTVLEVSNLINSSNKLNNLIESILLSSRKVMRAQSASMFLVEKETGDLLFSIVSNEKEKELTGFRVPKGQGIVGVCAAEKRTIVVDDAQNDPRVFKEADKSASYITRNLIASPLLVNGECIGVIEVLNKIGKLKFSANDAELFESFSDSVALAVHRRVLTDELEQSNIMLERRLRETQTLHAVTAAMIHDGTANEMFDRVVNEITNYLDIDIITILIYDDQKNTFDVAATSNKNFELDSIDFNQNSVAKQVFLTNEAILINDISANPELSSLANTSRYSSGSCILIPLSTDKNEKPVGLLCATEPKEDNFGEQDFQLLLTISAQLLKGYQNIQMKEEVLAKQAIEKELEITSRIQKNILPDTFAKHRHITLDAMSKMAKTTGGDFYDYFVHTENGPTSFLVADVSGKSLPAALFMAVSCSILRTFIRMDLEPTEALGKANDLLNEESESGMFVTAFLSKFDPATNVLKYASGGHNEMILMHPDGSYELLSGKGHPLGILPTYLQKYKGGEITIQDNDLLILYSDGIVEAEDPVYNEYGMDRFIEILRKNIHGPVDTLVSEVYQSVEAFSDQQDLSDDFTMMAIRFKPVKAGKSNYHFKQTVGRDSIPILREKIKEICINHGLYGEDLEDILLVTDEAATNIIIHAFEEHTDAGSQTFECDLQIDTRNYIRLLFKDKGREFNLNDVESPNISENLAGKKTGGFGVFLIKSLSNKLDYHRRNGINHLTIEKNLKRNPPEE